MRSKLFTAALAGLALTWQLAGAATPAAAEPSAIGWATCGTTYTGECATIKVPLDYADPAGPAIDLAIGRLKALDPAKRKGVLFVHPGGPGGSGINAYILNRAAIPDSSPLRQYFDIVSVDPRGVGRSTPILCDEDVVDRTPATYPADETEYRAWLAFNAKLSQNCRERTGPLFDHVDTTTVARDVDSIRAALGERQISFFAISYGTQVGQQYAELFPGNLRAMAIDSNMDHSITSPYAYLKTTTEDLEESFEEFAAWCRDTAACALHDQDVTAVWDGLFAKAEAGELADPDSGGALSAESLRMELFDAMYNPAANWFPLAERLKALASQQPAARAAALAEPVNYAYPVIWCSDWSWNVSGFAELDAYQRKLRKLAPHTRLSPFWSDVLTCLNWQGKVSNPQHRLDITPTAPTLVVKARADVGTPKAWNYAAAGQIPRSVVLEYDGVGHGQFRNSTCARELVETYLIIRRPPATGTHCPAQYPSAATQKAGPLPAGDVVRRPAH
ncbi:alpha/beta fold hydrolase [Nonomuraea sp. NPDC049695]|uniref:alpha/beta fold hydrolase n=1 Tax=Nonomuraea sp. NPDC049695 TaxID=3154734 RepID=UPI003416AB90